MQQIVTALAAQQDELDVLLSGLDADGWASPTRCPGWTVADVVLHLAQTAELAVASAEGRLGEVAGRWIDRSQGTVDEAAGAAVEAERGASPAEVLARWRAAVRAERVALLGCAVGARVQWVSGELAARSLATTRLAECWIHGGDVADAVGADLGATEHLWHVARLAWATLPYAFQRAGAAPPGSILIALDAPDGGTWSFGDAGARTRVTGSALDFCLLAARRLPLARARVTAEGPDAAAVLALVRTYA